MDREWWDDFEGEVVDGKYHLGELLAEPGWHGAVFRADEVVNDRLMNRVAIKLIRVNQSDIERQLRELQATATFKHENILDHYARGSCSLQSYNFLYIVMEVAEETLLQRLDRGRLSDHEALDLAKQIASALNYMHSQEKAWVHRDLKPANIMRVGNRWKLADLGLIRPMKEPGADLTGTLVGTAGYAPPESYQGVVSPAWDIWSLGVVLLESLTGENPFNGRTTEQMIGLANNHQPEMPKDLAEPLFSAIRGCIEKNREARPTALSLSIYFNSPNSDPGTLIRRATPSSAPSQMVTLEPAMEGTAEWTYRMIADTVDLVGCAIVTVICIVIANLWAESSGAGAAAGQSLVRIAGISGAACCLFSPALRGGCTFGKRLAGLAVVDANRKRPMAGRIVLRQILAIAPLYAAFYWSVAFGLVAIALYIVADAAAMMSPSSTEGTQRRWYDTLSGTSVVRTGAPLIGFK